MGLLPYPDYRATARDLDVVAFEGRGAVSTAIRAITGGSVTHVGLALHELPLADVALDGLIAVE